MKRTNWVGEQEAEKYEAAVPIFGIRIQNEIESVL